MLLGPSSSKIAMRNSFNMSKYTTSVTMCSPKMKGLNMFCLNLAHVILNMGLSLVPSITACKLLLTLILILCQFMCLQRWKLALSLNTFWLQKVGHSQVLKNFFVKCVANLMVIFAVFTHVLDGVKKNQKDYH